MKASDFIYARATTLAEAFELKALHGPDAKWLAGGQSLLASLAFRLAEPPALIDISGVEALTGIVVDQDVVRIGAATTYTALARSEIIRTQTPLIAQTIPLIAHAAIRNRGTIGGSLAFADPAAELPACVVALGATLVLASAAGERRVAAREFFQGVYATHCAADELVVAIEVPVAQAGERQTIYELTRRSGDYALMGVAAIATLDEAIVRDARVVFFAAGDRPMVATNTAAALIGQALDDDTLDRAAKGLAGDLDPASDLNGTAKTKLHLARVVLRRALSQFAQPTTRNAA